MLAEKYFPKGTARYQFLSELFQKLDSFSTLKPERWFGVLAMVLAGANVAGQEENRGLYWDWPAFSYFLGAIMIMALVWGYLGV